MSARYLWQVFVRAAVSLLCAGIFYFAWMAVFLLAAGLDSSVTILWLLAPVTTATGFATGSAVSERLTGARKTKFLRLFTWPLIGCVIGAVAVYGFGPMLIVFAMLAAGTASVVLREVVLHINQDEN